MPAIVVVVIPGPGTRTARYKQPHSRHHGSLHSRVPGSAALVRARGIGKWRGIEIEFRKASDLGFGIELQIHSVEPDKIARENDSRKTVKCLRFNRFQRSDRDFSSLGDFLGRQALPGPLAPM